MKPSATADFDQRYQPHLTYRWRDGKTKKMATHTVSGAAFLWLLMQHVLPKSPRAMGSGLALSHRS